VDSKRRRLSDDFRGHFRGELLTDRISRGLYATDASLFEIEPLAVAAPRDEEDLRFLVKYAGDQQIPIIPRGAGTGVAGESLGPGLVIDLSIHFRGILEIGSDWARVQPGVVCRNLNAVLARHGRRFAPDPSSAASCTIGGMLATNASGGNAALHGYSRDHLMALRVVFDNGDADLIGKGAPEKPTSRTDEIYRSVDILLRTNKELIEAHRPRTPFNRCGYILHDVLGPAGLDLAKLLTGSEGTLALFSEATLKTVPLPGGRSAALLGFESLDAALRGAEHARRMSPSACDLLDRRLLTLARGQSPESAKLIPASAEAILLVEFERDDLEEARQAGLQLIDLLQRVHRLAPLALPALGEEDIARLWQVRDAALPALYTLAKGPRPLAFIEDIGVPVDEMPEFLNRLQVILQRFETTASFLIHAATGQIHARPFLDLNSPSDVAKLWAIAEQVHGLVIEMGGTVSTQHGTGIARTPWVEKQYGRLFPVFRELKHIFDPRGILNPGKIVGPDPSRPAWPLRTTLSGEKAEDRGQKTEDRGQQSGEPSPVRGRVMNGSGVRAENGAPVGEESRPMAETPSRLLLWQADEISTQVSACNGCGACRTEEFHQRMCPIFRVTHGETATPRAKANMMREVLASAESKMLGASDVREVADLCVNCKMCSHECPAHVNIPKLMLEAKAAHHAEHGLDRADWFLARTEAIAALGSNFALTTNTILSIRPFRWILERFFGVSRRRRLPAFAARSFLKRARRRGWTRKTRRQVAPQAPGGANGEQRGVRRVAYFVDLYANYIDPLIADATVAVLRHQGIEVFVPPEQKGSGMDPLALGDVELARETVAHNLRILAELTREGYTILCSEPTAAIMLRQDVFSLSDDPDLKLVAENTVELTSFLWQLHEQGRLRTDFQPLEVSLGHHVPCHVKALGLGIHGPKLLALIPRLKVHTIDVSCSGMAGTFGLKAENLAVSLQAGQPMLEELARPRALFGSTECSTCRMQMEHGSGKRTLHPVQYLALAYGLLPEIGRKLRVPLKGLVLK